MSVNTEYHFEAFTPDFVTWVVFYGDDSGHIKASGYVVIWWGLSHHFSDLCYKNTERGFTYRLVPALKFQI